MEIGPIFYYLDLWRRHWIWVIWNINEHISTNIHHKNTPKNIWNNDTHTIKNGKTIVVILYIYQDRAIFVLSYDNKDTLSTKCEIELIIYQLRSMYKIYQRLYGTMISIFYKMGENIVTVLHIYKAISIFLLFFDDQDTLSTECEI